MSTAVVALGEFAVSSSVSLAVAQSANLDTLKTALITFAVSLVTVAGGELVKLIASWLQKKRKEIEGKEEDGKEGEKMDEKKGG